MPDEESSQSSSDMDEDDEKYTANKRVWNTYADFGETKGEQEV